MSDTSAASRILFTFELAEQVLLCLGAQDLSSAESVCRTWRTLISTSPPFRQNLFLEPTPHPLSIVWKSEGNDLVGRRHRTRLNWRPYVETYTIALLHPFFTQDTGNTRRGLIAFNLNWRKALTLSSGRWQSMFITQPPCRNVRVEYRIETRAGAKSGNRDVRHGDGVRLAMIVDLVRDVFAQAHQDAKIRASSMCQQAREATGPQLQGSYFERLDCYVDGFILETAALVLQAKGDKSAGGEG